MIKEYQQQAIQNPHELSKKIFSSIRIYLQEYKDTSKTKDVRIQSLKNAEQILDWTIGQTMFHVDTFEKEIVQYGLNKIYDTIDKAIQDTSKVYDMNDAIGFLKILEG